MKKGYSWVIDKLLSLSLVKECLPWIDLIRSIHYSMNRHRLSSNFGGGENNWSSNSNVLWSNEVDTRRCTVSFRVKWVLLWIWTKYENNLRGRDLLCINYSRKCTFYKIKQKQKKWLLDTGMEAIIDSLFSSFRFRLPLSSTIE